MTLLNGTLLFLAAMLAGALNSVAGGGSFISFPALVFAGIQPIPANATSTVALWPGSVASVGAYWNKFPRGGNVLLPLVLASLIGGVLGAVLLLRTPPATFMRLVSYLFLAATLLFAFGRKLSEEVGGLVNRSDPPGSIPIAVATVVQLGIAVYGGYFGGGIGILMLALLSMTPMRDIHSMNGLKSVLAAAINGAAVITFIIAGAVVWPQAVLMLAGAIQGGYGGARFAQRLDPGRVRGFVIFIGFSMAAYFLWRY